jgi:hypothetical protein
MIVTGVRSTPELERYRVEPELRRAVDAAHDARCGCENWVACCLLRPGFLEHAVQEMESR